MSSKKKLNKFLLLFLLLASSLYCNETITLQWLESKPRSFTKDFYIWQFLQQEITPNEAAIALGEAQNVNHTLFKLYAKKFNHDETYAVVECLEASAKELLQTSADCLALGLTPSKAVTLSYQEKKQAIEILQDKYTQESSYLKILNAPLPFTKLLATTPELFFKIFNTIHMDFIEVYFNYKIPQSIIEKLSHFNEFNQTIKRITTNNKLTNLQEALLENSFNKSKLTHQTLFYLALNALKYEKSELTLSYLQEAKNKAYFKKDKDKVLFWLYKISQNSEFLEELSKSYDINLYSLYAKEKLNKKPENIIYTLDVKKKKSSAPFDTSDPFAWIETKKNPSLDYQLLFNTKESLPHLAFMLEKKSNYQTFYYITPYKEYMTDYDKKRQALIYALAKKESHFIPTAVSSAYALGVMQIMPFLSQAIAKEFKEPYSFQEQFSPKTNIKYANYHLNYLEKHLVNPLFIAYAYNGGIGFMKRTLQKGFLQNKNSYEPFLSMELMSNEESREYGKQVLANYYIYINYLDKKNPTKLSTLLENLEHNFPK